MSYTHTTNASWKREQVVEGHRRRVLNQPILCGNQSRLRWKGGKQVTPSLIKQGLTASSWNQLRGLLKSKWQNVYEEVFDSGPLDSRFQIEAGSLSVTRRSRSDSRRDLFTD